MPLVRLLGPVDVVDDTGAVRAPGSPLRRTLLALLALEPRRTIPADELLDRIWDGHPPASGRRALRFHISKLRAELAIDDLTTTIGSGYRLDADTDLAAIDAAGPHAEIRKLESALAGWRGEPFQDAAPCETLDQERRRLEHRRLALVETLHRRRVEAGDADGVADLERLCLVHPLRESLWMVLANAHYVAGDQAEALRTIARLRISLREELGVDPSPEVAQLEQRILNHDLGSGSTSERSAPRTRAIAGDIGNLPIERTTLIGRDELAATVDELLEAHRLVTLTGVGGVGKTRLALELARRRQPAFADGAWLVKLAEAGDDDAVAGQILSTLGIRPRAGLSMIEVVVDTLSTQQILLVLDNCEHVIDGVSMAVDRILDGTESVTVLTTSREGLGVPGERLVAVPPLASTAPDSPAVELFLMRSADVGWTASDDDLEVATALCHRLDGVPLAIELAAAQTRSMPVGDIAARIGDRFRLLTGRRRSVERHQSLHATVSWSYGLLSEREQRVFDRLSVFTGPFELAAAEAVCADADLDAFTVVQLVGALVDKSMVTSDGTTYELLETLRQYGEEQLADGDAPHRYRDAHLRHYVGFSIAAHAGLQSADEGQWWKRIVRAQPNLRAAFEWALVDGETGAAMALTAHLGWAGLHHLWEEPGQWADQLVELADAADDAWYATCLGIASIAAITRGEQPRDLELAMRATAVPHRADDELDYHPIWAVAACSLIRGEIETALDNYLVLSKMAAEAGAHVQHAGFLARAAWSLQYAGRHHESLPLAREARRIAERTGCPSMLSLTQRIEGNALLSSDPALATAELDGARRIALEAGADGQRFQVDVLRSIARIISDEPLDALSIARENCAALRRRALWGWWVPAAIPAIAALERLGDAAASASLLPAVTDSTLARLGRAPMALDGLEARLVDRLGDDQFRRLVDRAAASSIAESATLLEQAADRHLTKERLSSEPR